MAWIANEVMSRGLKKWSSIAAKVFGEKPMKTPLVNTISADPLKPWVSIKE